MPFDAQKTEKEPARLFERLGSAIERRQGAGPFVTLVSHTLPSGWVRLNASRRDRKGLGPQFIHPDGTPHCLKVGNPWLRFWAPDRLAWWVAVCFVLGSVHFTLGPVFSISGWGLAGRARALWYFIGSIFFTMASYLQYLEALNAPLGPEYFGKGPGAGPSRPHWRWFGFFPKHVAFWASFPQFLGTLCFNVNCWAGLSVNQSVAAAWEKEWATGVTGSVFFLVSAWFAILEVCHTHFAFEPRNISWWVVWTNFLGCAGFLVGAILALPGVGSGWILCADNWFNFQGGLFFLISSYLMLPELFSE
ncbi:MAG: hypothetical protein AB7D07_03925 [Desulfovibrionaceae bacterium]